MNDVSALLGPYGDLAQRAERGRGAEVAMENKVWYLRQNRLFARADEASIENCQHLFTTTIYPKRALVFEQGDTTRTVFLIKRGKIRLARRTVDGKEVTVAILGAGDIFGEETLFEDRERTTVAICLEETLLCTARADDLFGLLAQSPELALNVAQILSERLGDASATMEDLAYARVADRILHLLERLAHEHGRVTAKGTVIDLTLTHADIASLIGSTRETVSVELSHLLKSDRLAQVDNRFVLPRAPA
ncbi:MAG: Crp/Fnr family transcriptional regulator [Vulcanimicrobiaceae bacterium]